MVRNQHERNQTLPLVSRSVGSLWRYAGFGTREPDSSAARIVARIGETVLLGLLLVALSAAPALAAPSDPAPDRAPSSTPITPTPDAAAPPTPLASGGSRPATPAPTARHAHSAGANTAIQRTGSAGYTRVGPPARHGPTPAAKRALVSEALALARERPTLRIPTSWIFTATKARRDGVLLLLSSLALAVLVVASLALLRLLIRLDTWYGRPTG